MTQTQLRQSRPRFLGQCLFLFGVASMLLLPLVGQLLNRSEVQADNRALAAAPSWPTSIGALVKWPRLVDAYVNDHFGLRPMLVAADVYLHWHMLGTSMVPSIVPGRHDRLFFSDGDVPFRVLLGNCGAWWSEDARAQFAHAIAVSLDRLSDAVPGISVLVVPTASVIYPDDLPFWIARACAGRTPLTDDLVQRLPEWMRARIAYPRDLAATLPAATPLIPQHNFHWDGRGVYLFIAGFAERELKLQRQVRPSWADEVHAADLGALLPGVELTNFLQVPSWPDVGMTSCYSPDCLGAPPLDGIALSGEMTRIRRSGAGGRLLVLSDSFGSAASSALIGYYSDIIMTNMSQFQALSPTDRKRLWGRVSDVWQPDRILMVINDGNIGQLSRFADLVLAALR